MKTTLLTLLLLVSKNSYAKTCADVKFQSAGQCSDLKVYFDLSQCDIGKKQVEAKVECKKKSASASYTYDNRKWTVKYSFKEGKWGNSEWLQSSPITEKSKGIESVAEFKPAVTNFPSERAIAQEKKSIDYKFSGYFDFRYNSVENNDNPNVAHSGQPESGFSVEEAALYLNAQTSDFSFYLDLPLRRDKTAAGVSETNQLVLGADRAQAYIKIGLKENLNLTLGQFDTPYGVELNDSKDRVFVKTGLLYDYALPVTHTGVSIDGAYNSISYRLLAANSGNKGSFGNTATGDNQTEVGVTVGYSHDAIRSQVGYLSRAIEDSNDEKGGTRDLIDVTFGFNWGNAALDFEWASVNNDNKATKKNGSVFMFLPTYKINDQFLLGLRYEMLTDDAGATDLFEDADSIGLSAHWKHSEHLQFRSEFIKLNYNTQSGGTEGDQTRLTFTSLFSF